MSPLKWVCLLLLISSALACWDVGAFGSVTLERDTKTGRTYALKKSSKGHIVSCRLVKHSMNEKSIMESVSSAFILRLYLAYRDDAFLFLVLEPCLGGELFSLYQTRGFTGNQDVARFYIACCIIGLDVLHEKRVIYRDLKSENVLLDLKGYAKICDLGLAKVCVGRTFTFCGTPEYLAPETVKMEAGYGRAVDWWACGILLYELMVGSTPFEAADAMQIYKKIKQGVSKVKFPKTFPAHLTNLIKGLLEAKPTQRLGRKGGEAVMSQPWFADFDWNQLKERQLKPPYEPKLKSDEDLANFSSHYEAPPVEPFEDDGSQWDLLFGPHVKELEAAVTRKGASAGDMGAQRGTLEDTDDTDGVDPGTDEELKAHFERYLLPLLGPLLGKPEDLPEDIRDCARASAARWARTKQEMRRLT